jgi:hypothetical protein
MKVFGSIARAVIPLVLGLVAMLPEVTRADSNVTAPIASVRIYRGAAAQAGLVFFSSALQHPEGCITATDNIIYIDFASATEPDGKAIYSTVLAAFLAGRTVQFGVRGCASNGAPLVYSVEVMP